MCVCVCVYVYVCVCVYVCVKQVVDEIYDQRAAGQMGIAEKGQVVVMIHSGSRGLGHQVATDALTAMDKAMARE